MDGDANVIFPFSIQDYQRYVFGDDKLAHRFGTDLAKAYIAHDTTQSLTCTTTPSANLAIAVVSDQIPTATCSLRNHFVTCLNRHLVSIGARPAIKVDIYHADAKTYHIDRILVASRSLIVIGDLRTCPDQELEIQESLRRLNMDNVIEFVYLAQLDEAISPTILSPVLSSVIVPTLKDIGNIAQSPTFIMNHSFVHYMLGLDFTDFCQLLRRQDDSFARLLGDYTIAGGYYKDHLYQQNFKFLTWELRAREDLYQE